jgi:predicted nucleotidyltransferase
MSSSRVARLAAELKSALVRVDGVRAAYLFGSAVGSETPHDVDILVIYGPPLAPDTADSLGPLVEEAVAGVCSLPVHLIFFSEAEAREPRLVDGLEPLRLLFGQPHA